MKAAGAVILAVLLSACDYIRSAEPLVPQDDIVTLGAVILSGETSAHLLATHPHRPLSGLAPAEIAATLSGPGWTAAYTESVPLIHCNVMYAEFWPPARCLRAELPEPVRALATYTLAGTTPRGSFSGKTTVPPSPVVHQADTVRFVVGHPKERVQVDIRFDVPDGVEAATVDVSNAVQVTDSGSWKPSWLGTLVPRVLDIGASPQRVGAYGPWQASSVRFDIFVLGFEENYAHFVDRTQHQLLLQPWPDFGIQADEGIYGYFGAGARSAAGVSVAVEMPGTP